MATFETVLNELLEIVLDDDPYVGDRDVAAGALVDILTALLNYYPDPSAEARRCAEMLVAMVDKNFLARETRQQPTGPGGRPIRH
jgi:hypothetical protein